MIKLYDAPISGNVHKVRLLLGLLGQSYEKVAVDMQQGAHKAADYLKLNPKGQVPTLTDGDVVIYDSQAILVYLARKYGGEDWLPTDAVGMAHVMQWLSTAANEVANGLAVPRAIVKFGRKGDLATAQKLGHHILKIFDDRLADREWLESDRPTVADIACYPYVGLAPEGEIPLTDYDHVRAWLGRIEALPGYVAMPGLPATG